MLNLHRYDVSKVETCPRATQDVKTNLANREKAIKDAAYGPLNPKEPNDEFWKKKADRWDVSTAEAKKSRCGNCAAFIQTKEMLSCIKEGLEVGDTEQNAWDTIQAGDLGYCEAFDFKCAASRTCDAWISGGPIVSKASAPTKVRTGSMVSWNSSGGSAQGKVEHVMREGVLGVPKSSFSIRATKEDPAVLIRVYRDGKETETLVGHKASTLRVLKS